VGVLCGGEAPPAGADHTLLVIQGWGRPVLLLQVLALASSRKHFSSGPRVLHLCHKKQLVQILGVFQNGRMRGEVKMSPDRPSNVSLLRVTWGHSRILSEGES
jgi:hypothetical protein